MNKQTRKATIKDVARHAGVSPTTVSFLLNGKEDQISEETRERVHAAIRELDYTPNALIRSLQARETRTIGYYFGANVLANPYINEFFVGLHEAASDLGYDLLVYRRPREELERTTFADGRVDGVVCWPNTEAELRLFAADGLRTPAVLFADTDLEEPCSVAANDAQGIAELMEHLLARGCGRFFFVGNYHAGLHLRRRLSRFQEALACKGLRFEECLTTLLDWEEGMLRAFARRLKAIAETSETRIAVCCSHDLAAEQLMPELLAAGLRIPQDISLTGYEATNRAGITTVKQPVRELGRAAAERAVARITGGKAVGSLRMDTTFMVGTTS
ncbi:LacI family DNA-binding transcriptional regulator [Paenibacillus sacheonensis]|uniref:Substrate-binding domain-containing protein n=1 Tax=Paenibacillus sacheonensis TaxID=742054 RepID=A0A7X5C4G6_9BACL|nr:LacI family DNA-binding transcriptional regulator [Paenibacillus sacheonensis]MBM7568539.1 LacI family transcriptional regulator [Paenibacillus sacheonensis]NBC72364.1 substrate-binding domain-containing protein [Paenibacillus sacheonensis]